MAELNNRRLGTRTRLAIVFGRIRPSLGPRDGCSLAVNRARSRSARHVSRPRSWLRSGFCRAWDWQYVWPSGRLAMRIEWGRRPRFGLRPRCSSRLEFPGRSWKSPRLGRLPENAWQSEGRGLRRSVRPSAASQREIAKGELGPQAIPSAECTTTAGVIPGRCLTGEKASEAAEMLSDRFLP